LNRIENCQLKTAWCQTGGQKKSNFGFPMARRYNFPIHKTQHNALPANRVAIGLRACRLPLFLRREKG
jgi:hypothetical protein